MSPSSKRDDVKMEIARKAAILFWERGVARTRGEDIAAASGLSKRTVWRHFRSKEACVEPLLSATCYRLVTWLEDWPPSLPLEKHLTQAVRPDLQPAQDRSDDIAAVRLVSILPQEPALRTAWLMACAAAEKDFVTVVARRAGLREEAFEARLCAAAMMAAVRVANETFAESAVVRGESYSLQGVLSRLGAAMRSAATLPICDPVFDDWRRAISDTGGELQ